MENFYWIELQRKTWFFSCPSMFQRGLAMAAEGQREGKLSEDIDLHRWVLHSQACYLADVKPAGTG